MSVTYIFLMNTDVKSLNIIIILEFSKNNIKQNLMYSIKETQELMRSISVKSDFM